MAEHSALGSANTLRGVQKQRPSLFDLVDETVWGATARILTDLLNRLVTEG